MRRNIRKGIQCMSARKEKKTEKKIISDLTIIDKLQQKKDIVQYKKQILNEKTRGRLKNQYQETRN